MGMFDMLEKLKDAKEAMEKVKVRLDTISVDGESGEGQVKIIMNANRVVTNVHLDDRLMNIERKEELEELIELAFNRASEKAQNVSESEMKAAGKDILPNIPGLF